MQHLNYGNSDYDYWHSVSAEYFYVEPFKSSNRFLDAAIGGWEVGGTIYYKSGEPFSVYNTTARTSNLVNSTGGAVLADYVGSTTTCTNSPDAVCPSWSQFAFSQASGNRANQSKFWQSQPQQFSRTIFLQRGFKLEQELSGD